MKKDQLHKKITATRDRDQDEFDEDEDTSWKESLKKLTHQNIP